MINNNKKGQAAMEFLMTYGWAILAAIVVIAVLAIYFRPGNLVGNNALLSAPFSVQAQQLTTTKMEIEVLNSGADTLTNIVVTPTVQPSTAICTPTVRTAENNGGSATTTLAPGAKGFIYCAWTGTAPTAGTSVSVGLSVAYNRGGATLTSTSTGTISGKV